MSWPPPSPGVVRRQRQGRAEKLLYEHLTLEQRSEWHTVQGFTVWTPSRPFRLTKQWTYNVHDLDGPFRYCAGLHRHACYDMRECGAQMSNPCECDIRIPFPDHLLAQKLMIENDLEHFYWLANVAWKKEVATRVLDATLTGVINRSGCPFNPETHPMPAMHPPRGFYEFDH